MIYINSRFEGPVKDQIHPFTSDDLTFKFPYANAMLSFLTSIYDDPNRLRSVVTALGNLSQRNKAFTKPEILGDSGGLFAIDFSASLCGGDWGPRPFGSGGRGR